MSVLPKPLAVCLSILYHKDREVWGAAVHEVIKSRTQLSHWTTTNNQLLLVYAIGAEITWIKEIHREPQNHLILAPPHFHSLHQRNFWVNPPSFLSLILLLVSLLPPLPIVFSYPHPAHYAFSLLSLGWKPAQLYPRLKTPLLPIMLLFWASKCIFGDK